MIRNLTVLFAIAGIAAGMAAEKSLALKDLPPAVQKAIHDNLNGGQIRNIGKETEDGVAQYEVETMLSGKHRDFNVDTRGNLVVVEQETTLDAIPTAARAAILKKVGSGKVRTVETFQKPGAELMYEAGYTTRTGKHAEVLVKADGTETKE
ncbi:MAG TPA: hypothetical protein VML19_03140 [Verrucomicrobiae bacterium]|nr:hypothetical protein [Verrucomicrobiae bacterium]